MFCPLCALPLKLPFFMPTDGNLILGTYSINCGCGAVIVLQSGSRLGIECKIHLVAVRGQIPATAILVERNPVP